MEDAQDRRLETTASQTSRGSRTVQTWKSMPESEIRKSGANRSNFLKGERFRKAGQSKENLGQTGYQQAQPKQSPATGEAAYNSASSDDLNLKPGDSVPDPLSAGAPFASSSIASARSSESSGSSTDDDWQSTKQIRKESEPVRKTSVKAYTKFSQPLRSEKGISKNVPRARVNNLPMGGFMSEETRSKKSSSKPSVSLLQKKLKPGKAKAKVTKAQAKSPSKPRPFPMATGSAKLPKDTVRLAGSSDSSSFDDSDDPMRPNKSDERVNRGGPRPFPMSSQDRDDPASTKPPSSSSLASFASKRGSDTEDAGQSKRRRRSNESIESLSSSCHEVSLGPRYLDCDLCPYCDMPFPKSPSPCLQQMVRRIGDSYPDPRPSNPKGRKAPFLSYVNMCQRHRFEAELLPQAKTAGWPTNIDFNTLPSRIEGMKDRLGRILKDRSRSIFWAEAEIELRDGLRKATSIAGQLSSFERCQPGYYGEQGSVIIYRTLCWVFPPENLDPDIITPLSPSDFLERILVPECALALIQDDYSSKISLDKALSIMRDSSKFGSGMYPDLDSSGGNEASSKSSGHGVGETMLRVRAGKKHDDSEQLDSSLSGGSRRTAKNAPFFLASNAEETHVSQTMVPIVIDSEEDDGPKCLNLSRKARSAKKYLPGPGQSKISARDSRSKTQSSGNGKRKADKSGLKGVPTTDGWLLSDEED